VAGSTPVEVLPRGTLTTLLVWASKAAMQVSRGHQAGSSREVGRGVDQGGRGWPVGGPRVRCDCGFRWKPSSQGAAAPVST